MKSKGFTPIKSGFTLIELLIVIALLGALAVGLLAAVDPFEQLKKGNDTSTRNTVSEFYNASIRFYSVQNQFPWGTVALGTTPSSLLQVSTYITSMIAAGELKAKFIELAGTAKLAKMSVYSSAGDHIVVCFTPESKSFRKDLNTTFDAYGDTQADCSAGECMWCVQ